MNDVCQLLKESRLAKGLSLDEVAARTYIKLHYLEALEAGALDKLPAMVHTYGYIRQYAKLLGLDGGALVAQFQALERSVRQAPVGKRSGRTPTGELFGDSLNLLKPLRPASAPAQTSTNGNGQAAILGPDPAFSGLGLVATTERANEVGDGMGPEPAATILVAPAVATHSVVSVLEPPAREALASLASSPSLPVLNPAVPSTPSPYEAATAGVERPFAATEAALPDLTAPFLATQQETSVIQAAQAAQAAAAAQVLEDARKDAAQIRQAAENEARTLVKGAESYADQVLGQLEAEVSSALHIIQNGRQFLASRRRQTT